MSKTLPGFSVWGLPARQQEVTSISDGDNDPTKTDRKWRIQYKLTVRNTWTSQVVEGPDWTTQRTALITTGGHNNLMRQTWKKGGQKENTTSPKSHQNQQKQTITVQPPPIRKKQAKF